MNALIETPVAPTAKKDIFSTVEAAAYLGLAVSTLNKWRCYGEGPKYLKLGRAVRYRKQELDQFLSLNLVV